MGCSPVAWVEARKMDTAWCLKPHRAQASPQDMSGMVGEQQKALVDELV